MFSNDIIVDIKIYEYTFYFQIILTMYILIANQI